IGLGLDLLDLLERVALVRTPGTCRGGRAADGDAVGGDVPEGSVEGGQRARLQLVLVLDFLEDDPFPVALLHPAQDHDDEHYQQRSGDEVLEAETVFHATLLSVRWNLKSQI